jgi:hypothetical protein
VMAAMLRPSRSPAELGIHRGAEVWMTILKIVVAPHLLDTTPSAAVMVRIGCHNGR